jgi:hypothetical protein
MTQHQEAAVRQFYVGVKQVEAWPSERDGKPGYTVKYGDGYESWSPKHVFESAYLPMGFRVTKVDGGTSVRLDTDFSKVNDNRVTQGMVDEFIRSVNVKTEGKTTIVHATLANGFEIVESSSCVDPANYDEATGRDICVQRIKNQVWHLLGFALQWARHGLG